MIPASLTPGYHFNIILNGPGGEQEIGHARNGRKAEKITRTLKRLLPILKKSWLNVIMAYENQTSDHDDSLWQNGADCQPGGRNYVPTEIKRPRKIV